MEPQQDFGMPPPPKKSSGFLNMGSQPKQPGPDFEGISSDVNSISRRLRLLEESVTNLRRYFQITEENIITKNKYTTAEFKTVQSDIQEIRKDMHEVKEKFIHVVMELQTVARKDEVKVLEKYINLWNPIKFVTQNEIERIVTEILERKEKQKISSNGKL